MDWIHCNLCYAQPGELPKRAYNLSSCGHIFCEFCEKGEITECKVCKNKCTTTQIAGQMPQDVQAYFEDPDVVMGKLIKIMDFQRGHRVRLSEFRRILAIKYQKAKAEILRLREEINRVCEEINRLHEEINGLKRKIIWYEQKLGSRTPVNKPMSGPPLLPQNSQASQAIRAGASDKYYYNQQPKHFQTSGPSQNCGYSGYRYKSQGAATPGTPSDVSDSPASSIDKMTPHSQRFTPQLHQSQHNSHFRAGLTPPMSNLKLLSVASQKSRKKYLRNLIERLMKSKRVKQVLDEYRKSRRGTQIHLVFTIERRTTILEENKKLK